MTAFDLFWNFAICSQSKLVEAPHCTIFKEPKLFRTFTVTSENHLRRWILTCNHRHFGIYMPKHLAEQWLLVRSNSFRLPGSGEVPGVVRGRWEVGYVGLPATGKLRVDGGSGISRDCRASWMPRGFSLNENFWFISIQLSTSHWACSPFGKARLKSAVFFFRFLLCSARSSGAADLC